MTLIYPQRGRFDESHSLRLYSPCRAHPLSPFSFAPRQQQQQPLHILHFTFGALVFDLLLTLRTKLWPTDGLVVLRAAVACEVLVPCVAGFVLYLGPCTCGKTWQNGLHVDTMCVCLQTAWSMSTVHIYIYIYICWSMGGWDEL